jgi:hypothetical protein
VLPRVRRKYGDRKENKMPKSIFLLLNTLFFCLVIFTFGANSGVDSPLVHWSLDGNGEDSVGNNDLEIVGGDFEDGKYNQALGLDGSGAYAVDEDGADYINGLEAITVAMWIKSNQTDTDKGFFICNDPAGNDRDLVIRYDVAGSLGGAANVIKTGVNTVEGKTTLESSAGVQVTEWQHVAIVWSTGEQIKLYIDGVLDEPTANEVAIGGELSSFTKIIVGKGGKDQSGGWDGLIDDVYIYDEALSDEDIVKVRDSTALSVDASGKLAALWGQMKRKVHRGNVWR